MGAWHQLNLNLFKKALSVGSGKLTSELNGIVEEINKKVMTKKMQDDKLSSKNTLGDANEQLQELKDKMDGK